MNSYPLDNSTCVRWTDTCRITLLVADALLNSTTYDIWAHSGQTILHVTDELILVKQHYIWQMSSYLLDNTTCDKWTHTGQTTLHLTDELVPVGQHYMWQRNSYQLDNTTCDRWTRIHLILSLISIANFPPPAKFIFEAEGWTDWLPEFKCYHTASKLHNEPGNIQRDASFHSTGVKKAEKTLKTFNWGRWSIRKILFIKKFTKHCIPRLTKRHERAKFCERVQHPGETVAEFTRDLYELVATCDYADEDDKILDTVTQVTRDQHVRSKLQLEEA